MVLDAQLPLTSLYLRDRWTGARAGEPPDLGRNRCRETIAKVRDQFLLPPQLAIARLPLRKTPDTDEEDPNQQTADNFKLANERRGQRCDVRLSPSHHKRLRLIDDRKRVISPEARMFAFRRWHLLYSAHCRTLPHLPSAMLIAYRIMTVWATRY